MSQTHRIKNRNDVRTEDEYRPANRNEIQQAQNNQSNFEVESYNPDYKLTRLRNWTIACVVIHLLWTIVSLILYAFFDTFRDYGVDITLLKTDRFTYKNEKLFFFNITLAAGIFTFLSSIFHIITLANWKYYIDSIRGVCSTHGGKFDPKYAITNDVHEKLGGVNIYRWIEYSMSASLMSVIIAIICRITDFNTLLLIFALNGLVMIFGVPLEILRENENYNVMFWGSWLFYSIGSSTLFILLWNYTSPIPAIASASLITITILFQSFGAWQCCTVRRVKKFDINIRNKITDFTAEDYELGFNLLSVVAKSTLWGFVIWGGSTNSNWLRESFKCTFDSVYAAMAS